MWAAGAAPVKEAGLVVAARSRCVLRAGTASRPCGGPRPRGSRAAAGPPSGAGAGSVSADAATVEAGPEAGAAAAAEAGCETVAGLEGP